MSILSFLGFGAGESAPPESTPAPGEAETIHRIARALERMDRAQARHIAAFAFILSRVANADSHISEEETREMERRVMQWGELPAEQAALVVEIAKHQNILFGGTDNYVVTREFNRAATREQKTQLLHCLFAVSASDDSISSREEAAISQIARELKFRHAELMQIRGAYRDKLAVLKNLPE
ncbi:MAG: TerB family tellurite resistance protein [Acidobacteriota bacterium]